MIVGARCALADALGAKALPGDYRQALRQDKAGLICCMTNGDGRSPMHVGGEARKVGLAQRSETREPPQFIGESVDEVLTCQVTDNE